MITALRLFLQHTKGRALVSLRDRCDTLGAAADAGEAVRMNDIFSQATADAVLFLLFGRRLDFNSKHLERSTEEHSPGLSSRSHQLVVLVGVVHAP